MPVKKTIHAALAVAAFYAGIQLGPVARAEPDDWRAEASPEDARRLARIDQAWSEGLRQARQGGHRPDLANLGLLVDRKAALRESRPEPGAYYCRTVKLGSPGGRGPAFAAYEWFRCEVEEGPGGELLLEKITGSQRPWGRLYEDGARRLVYVGGQAGYGHDPAHDQIGAFERLGEDHYRLVLPWSKQASVLDLIELRR
ncbi:DUF4893 domain-containing protein [Phenylobacterium sp.]|jgi:hypothetical protein|uniref:DUF4893 domain-containing protein n=1 Tax=Phenylobacterium sp. TaxID=1871053 RepID=UPI002E351C89|nr:DUF4893 domain-containing protein [Phenylobacterium sp.]HEX2561359.1 DUF4893 domain-containing protein [Phenylobacterium sp.]